MSKKLYIGNLAESSTEQGLRGLFSAYGTVLNAKITVDHKGRSKGFAFVEMGAKQDAELAITKLNGEIHDGKVLTVSIAKPPESRDQRRVLANRRNRGKR